MRCVSKMALAHGYLVVKFIHHDIKMNGLSRPKKTVNPQANFYNGKNKMPMKAVPNNMDRPATLWLDPSLIAVAVVVLAEVVVGSSVDKEPIVPVAVDETAAEVEFV